MSSEKTSTDYFATGDIEVLRKRIDEITDQLCVAVSGNFDFTVRATVADETLDKLAMLINFLIEAARRSVTTLRAQNDSLSELDQMKTDFLANISHELRTPLTLILAPLRSMLAGQYGELPPSSIAVVERVLRNSVRLNGLVNDLLDVSKLEAGRMSVKLEPVDPSDIVQMLVAELQPAARERSLTIQADTALWPRGVRALLDTNMFEKIALNLLSNAYKFTPDRGTVTASVSLDGIDTIVMSISDSGIGIADDHREMLFKRFRQVDSSSNRTHAGTGLGLALVKEFTELMKGTVTVESSPGVGSTFTVRIPFVETRGEISTEIRTSEIANLVATSRTRAPDHAPQAPALFRPTILVVEDNLDLQQYVFETLASDYNVIVAGNGHEAIRVLSSQHPDVILSDVMMPGMDGLELLRRTKAHASWKFIPFIMLTARVSREERLSGLDEGADDYLTKPFDAIELKTRLRAALRVRALYRELEAKNYELEQARGGLQRKVEERTYELSLQSQKALAANKAKDQFLANMSHEMRTPLTAIMGFSDLLMSGVSAVEAQEFQETIRRNAHHLLSLIDEILDFSKIESGHVTIERTQINLGEFVSNIESTFKPIVDSKAIDFSLKIDANVPQVLLTDPKRLRQMLTNLIGNAVKFTERGSVRTEFHVIDDRGAPQLRIRVVDTGIGISPESHSKLFAPFSQADMSLSRKYGGTGLGLALSRKIARSLGGELMLETSEPGRGSIFTLWVPVEIPVQPSLGSARAKRSPLAPRGTLTGLHILLAEDSVDNQRLLKRLLEGAGAFVDLASDGEEAVTLASSGSHDIVLMDIQMPRKDGYAATRELRAGGYKKPILALTAHASDRDLERVLEAGCNDRLVKPIEVDQMISSLLAATALSRA